MQAMAGGAMREFAGTTLAYVGGAMYANVVRYESLGAGVVVGLVFLIAARAALDWGRS